jgi:hypothetical protein
VDSGSWQSSEWFKTGTLPEADEQRILNRAMMNLSVLKLLPNSILGWVIRHIL